MYEVTLLEKLNLYATGTDEILQNVSMILSTPKGSVPLDRNFGVDLSMLDMPIEMAQNLFTVQVIEAVQDYEPRATIQSVSYERNHLSGKLKPIVKVVINDA